MPELVVTYPHISKNAKGRAIVDGTRSKVTMIVRDHLYGMTSQEIHEAYPHLSLAAIHAALGYYYDHKAELDSEMAESDEDVERILGELKADGKCSSLQERLNGRHEKEKLS